MSRKKEINNDLWEILCKVYDIGPTQRRSDRQDELLDKIVEYIDTNLSTRRKKPDKCCEKENICLSELNK